MKPTAMYVAIHEAGHALASWWTGRGVSKMTAYFEDEDPDEYSHAQTFPKKPWPFSMDVIDAIRAEEAAAVTDEEVLEAKIGCAVLEVCVTNELLNYYAGPLAEAKFRGVSLDEVAEVGGYDDMSNVYLLLGVLSPGQRYKAQSAARRRAARLVDHHWPAIEAVAAELHPRGFLDGADVEALLERVTGERPGEFGTDFTSLDY